VPAASERGSTNQRAVFRRRSTPIESRKKILTRVVRRHHGFSSLEKWEAQRTVLYKLPVIKKTHGTVQKRKIDRMMRGVFREKVWS
jgi:hypothetical protein